MTGVFSVRISLASLSSGKAGLSVTIQRSPMMVPMMSAATSGVLRRIPPIRVPGPIPFLSSMAFTAPITAVMSPQVRHTLSCSSAGADGSRAMIWLMSDFRVVIFGNGSRGRDE